MMDGCILRCANMKDRSYQYGLTAHLLTFIHLADDLIQTTSNDTGLDRTITGCLLKILQPTAL